MTYIREQGSGAPKTAKFIVQEPHAALDNEQALNALADGVLLHVGGVVGTAEPGVDYAEAVHGHAQSEITGLVTALSGKADTSHVHAASDVTSGVLAAARLGTGTPNGTKFLRDDSQWVVPTAADPWTYLVLASDFVTSSASAVNVTGMAFTPLANTRYEVEAFLMLRTATTTVGPRPGCAWPTGLTDGVASIQLTSAAGTNVFQNGSIAAALLAPVGGLPLTTGSYPAFLKALFQAGASPAGTWRLQLASETAATNVTLRAGSILKYRTY